VIRARRGLIAAVSAAGVALAVTGLGLDVGAGTVAASTSHGAYGDRWPAAASPSVLTLLDTVAVKGRAPKTGYSRERFGPAWTDTDRNGCDTRNDILRRDLTAKTIRPGTHGCLVESGVLADPYTARTIRFTRGSVSSMAVQIDHVVALSDAWQKGAAGFAYPKRMALANDPLNLLAVDGPTNAGKSDGDAATWLPPNRAYRCAYVARQVAVKAKYRMWVTAAEKVAIRRVLAACRGLRAPTGGTPTTAPNRGTDPGPPAPTSRPPSPRPSPSTSTGGALDPRYPFCTDVIAHGYGPYQRGRDPEYAWYRDGDKDGWVCER
jgi:hypothetical protein